MSGADAVAQVVSKVLPKVTPRVLESVNWLTGILKTPKFPKLFDPTVIAGEAASITMSQPTNHDSGESALIHLARQGMGPHIEVLMKEALRGSTFKDQRDLLKKIAGVVGDPSKEISSEDRNSLMQLLTEIAAGEKVTEESAKMQNSADTLMDGALDNALGIVRRQLSNSGSVLGLLTKIPGVLPEEITDETKMKEYVEGKVLNDDFKTCMKGYLTGENVNVDNLDKCQKMTLRGFKGAMWVLKHTPQKVLEFLPAVGTVSGFFAKHIPFYGLVNMMLMFLGTYQKELQEVKGLMEQFHKGKDIITKSLDPITQLAAQQVKEVAEKAAGVSELPKKNVA